MSTASVPRGFTEIAPHKLIRHFLGLDMVKQLLAHADTNRAAFTPTGLGDGRIDPEVRVSLLLRDFGPLRDFLVPRFGAVMDQAQADLRLSPFELERLELELVAHGNGAFYRRHIDTRTGESEQTTERVLSGVFYFYAPPKAYDGGELRLHSVLPPEQGGHYLDIVPEQDMLLLFPSWAPHEVRPITCPSGEFMNSRFAINCWYHRRRVA
jgi:SM-20-related protein